MLDFSGEANRSINDLWEDDTAIEVCGISEEIKKNIALLLKQFHDNFLSKPVGFRTKIVMEFRKWNHAKDMQNNVLMRSGGLMS